MTPSRLAALAALLVLVPAAARAEEYATTKDAELMVHQAASYLRKNGREKTFAAIDDPKGPFTYRDLYVMAYDLDGVCLAHGFKKDRVGKSMLKDRDADGKEYVKERLQIVRQHGKGWQEYKFANPLTKKVEQKVAYFELVDGVVLVSGAYKQKT